MSRAAALFFALLLGLAGGCSRSRVIFRGGDSALAGTGALGDGSQLGTAGTAVGPMIGGDVPDGRRDDPGRDAPPMPGTAGAAPPSMPAGGAPAMSPPPPPPMPGQRGDGRGSGGSSGGDVGVAGTAAGSMGGSGGSGPSIGRQILNPRDCQSERPFVLTIFPSGDRGKVSGWLESTPTVAFKNQLPRFEPTPDADLALWWSIGSLAHDGQEPLLYFYGENDATQVAVAQGARDFEDIDFARLSFDDWVTPAIAPGTIAVFRNIESGEVVAMRADAILDTDPRLGDSTCAAIEASWSFDL